MIFKEIDRIEMGTRIRNRREMLNITRAEMGKELLVTERFIADVECGSKGFSLRNLYRIQQYLNISANYIIDGDDISLDENESIERKKIKENILSLLGTCSTEQMGYIESIVRLYIKGVIGEDRVGKK